MALQGTFRSEMISLREPGCHALLSATASSLWIRFIKHKSITLTNIARKEDKHHVIRYYPQALCVNEKTKQTQPLPRNHRKMTTSPSLSCFGAKDRDHLAGRHDRADPCPRPFGLTCLRSNLGLNLFPPGVVVLRRFRVQHLPSLFLHRLQSLDLTVTPYPERISVVSSSHVSASHFHIVCTPE